MARSRSVAVGPRKARALEREAHWRAVVTEWSRSGLSQAAFCREHRLPAKTFHWWRSELSRRDGARKRRPGKHAVPAQGESPKPQFVPLRVASSRPRVDGGSHDNLGDGRVGVDVLLAHGRRVRVAPGFDADVLAAVVSVLEQLAW